MGCELPAVQFPLPLLHCFSYGPPLLGLYVGAAAGLCLLAAFICFAFWLCLWSCLCLILLGRCFEACCLRLQELRSYAE